MWYRYVYQIENYTIFLNYFDKPYFLNDFKLLLFLDSYINLTLWKQLRLSQLYLNVVINCKNCISIAITF